MCLSAVYRDEVKKENLLMSDVAAIDAEGGSVTLTDLFGRTLTVEGRLRHADLTGGVVVLEVAQA